MLSTLYYLFPYREQRVAFVVILYEIKSLSYVQKWTINIRIGALSLFHSFKIYILYLKKLAAHIVTSEVTSFRKGAKVLIIFSTFLQE